MTADLDPAVSPDLARLEAVAVAERDGGGDDATVDFTNEVSPAVVLALIHRLRAAEEVLLNAQGERYMLDASRLRTLSHD